MRTVYAIAVLIALAAVVLPPARSGNKEKAEKELIQLEEQFAEAGTRRDVEFLQRFLAEDFLGYGVRGEALTKTDVIGRFEMPGYGVTSIRHEDIRVRVFGDWAVATARSVIVGTHEGRDVGGQSHYMHVLQKRKGRWQVVAAHSTPLAVK